MTYSKRRSSSGGGARRLFLGLMLLIAAAPASGGAAPAKGPSVARAAPVRRPAAPAAPAARRPAAPAARRPAAAPRPGATPLQRAVSELVAQGDKLMGEGHFEEAIHAYEEARVRDPKLSRVLLFMGICHLQLGHAQQAMLLFDRLQDESGTLLDADAMGKLRRYYGQLADKLAAAHKEDGSKKELLLLAGRARFRAGQLDEAGALYRRYEREVGPDAGPMQKLREDYLREYYEAVVRREKKRLTEEAAGPETYLSIGEAQLGLGDDEAAVDAFDSYREVTGGGSAARLQAGYRTLAQKLEGRVGPALLVSGRARFGMGDLPAAAGLYARYRSENPRPPLAYRERLARYLREDEEERLRVERRRPRPVYKKPWFWTVLGAVAVGTATAIAVPLATAAPSDPLAGIPDGNRRTVTFSLR